MLSPDRPLLADGTLHDAATVPPGDLDVAAAVAAHRALRTGPDADLVGAMLVPASAVDELRDATEPDDALRIALVADEGLLGLAEARHAVQDDPWTELTHVQIALPAGFDPAAAVRALLDELSFTVPTYVELPRTGFEQALDVLAEDGVERATYRCCGADGGSVPTDGELAGFVHGAVTRSVPFSLMAGPGHLLRGEDPDGGSAHHGLLNVLSAVAATLDGASTSDVADLLGVRETQPLLDVVEQVSPFTVRDAFQAYACTDVSRVLAQLRTLASGASS